MRDCFYIFPYPVAQSCCHIVIDLARLIVAFAPKSLHTKELADRFRVALLEASAWDKNLAPPMTTPKEKNLLLLLLLRTFANAFQKDATFEYIDWALKVIVHFFTCWEGGIVSSDSLIISMQTGIHRSSPE